MENKITKEGPWNSLQSSQKDNSEKIAEFAQKKHSRPLFWINFSLN